MDACIIGRNQFRSAHGALSWWFSDDCQIRNVNGDVTDNRSTICCRVLQHTSYTDERQKDGMWNKKN